MAPNFVQEKDKIKKVTTTNCKIICWFIFCAIKYTNEKGSFSRYYIFLYLCRVLIRKSQVVAHPGFLIIDLLTRLRAPSQREDNRVT